MIHDFHTHTFLSDGALSPLELMYRALRAGYRTIALTDHVGIGHLERLISEIAEDCRMARSYWNITAIPGVELTYVPAQATTELAKRAKELGAMLVVVHGETVTEPVEQGTNLAALKSPHVDILAHPGFLTLEEARLAAQNDIFLEISARKGHCLANEHIAEMAKVAGAKLLLNSDAHDEEDLLSLHSAHKTAEDAGRYGPGSWHPSRLVR